MNSYAYYNGKFGRKKDIQIPLSDRSIFFGDAVYDVAIGCYDRIMWESEHIDRFLGNAQRLGIDHTFTPKTLSALLREIAIKSMIDKYMIYFQLSRDSLERRHSAEGCGANLLVTVEPMTVYPTPKSIKLITMSDLRYGYCDIKTANLLPAVLSVTKAEGVGCDEAVFIKEGLVTECSKSNILIIKQGRIITHPNCSSILPGIVKSHILSICSEMGLSVEERPFRKAELFSADEVLVSSTTKLFRTATEIDSVSVGGRDRDLVSEIYNMLYTQYNNLCIL